MDTSYGRERGSHVQPRSQVPTYGTYIRNVELQTRRNRDHVVQRSICEEVFTTSEGLLGDKSTHASACHQSRPGCLKDWLQKQMARDISANITTFGLSENKCYSLRRSTELREFVRSALNLHGQSRYIDRFVLLFPRYKNK
ncbi:hypothetical protein LIA77_10561 [Sarocladium implicatum]|nr:hypothetical protein LIA77_10561 [Sarocladium implicatum]